MMTHGEVCQIEFQSPTYSLNFVKQVLQPQNLGTYKKDTMDSHPAQADFAQTGGNNNLSNSRLEFVPIFG